MDNPWLNFESEPEGGSKVYEFEGYLPTKDYQQVYAFIKYIIETDYIIQGHGENYPLTLTSKRIDTVKIINYEAFVHDGTDRDILYIMTPTDEIIWRNTILGVAKYEGVA